MEVDKIIAALQCCLHLITWDYYKMITGFMPSASIVTLYLQQNRRMSYNMIMTPTQQNSIKSCSIPFW